MKYFKPKHYYSPPPKKQDWREELDLKYKDVLPLSKDVFNRCLMVFLAQGYGFPTSTKNYVIWRDNEEQFNYEFLKSFND